MLRQRILTVALLLPPLVAALFYLPNLYWSLLMTAALLVAAHEWGRLAGLGARAAWAYAAGLGAAALAITAAESLRASGAPFVYSLPGRLLYFLCVILWLAIVPAWLNRRWVVRNPIALLCVGVAVLLPFWHAVSWLQTDPRRLLLVLSVIWVADTAAYFAGRAFGRHRLALRISPGKTWEGVVGALLAVSGSWLVVSGFIAAEAGSTRSGLILVVVLTLIGIEGDLFESWLKRMAGQKDSGELLPGHGGLLDRIDALTSSVPLAALYFAYPGFRL
jgi:phosphatidate cytidylyltransferase